LIEDERINFEAKSMQSIHGSVGNFLLLLLFIKLDVDIRVVFRFVGDLLANVSKIVIV